MTLSYLISADDLPEGVHKGPWAVCGIGLLPGDKRMSDILHEQEFLYTVRLPNMTGST